MKKKIIKTILDWYTKNKRDLPWRHTRDPYKILVAEVMLQQTQVDRVIPKYHSFLRRFPTVQKLARARTSSVIKEWKGLGYNRRALFLQRGAKAVVKEFGGTFPDTLEALKSLPGVGDYTSRAILSFAYEKPFPMMDTNHRRFYQRVFFGVDSVSDKELLLFAEQLLRKTPSARPSGVASPPRRGRDYVAASEVYDWNQALMDFGSGVCLTRKPKCEECPVREYCVAYPDIMKHEARSMRQKRKNKKTIPFKETDRYFRGRVVDYLRLKNKDLVANVRKLFPEIDDERFLKIITKLQKDGLIRVEKKWLKLA